MTCLFKMSFAIVLLVLCFCDMNKNPKAEHVTFEIDDAKVSESIIDDNLNLKYKIPNTLQPLSENSTAKLATMLDSINLIEFDISIHPEYIFVDSVYSFILMINTISFIDTMSQSENLDSIYISYLNNRLEKYILKKGTFLKDEILMTQYVIKDDPKMIFKLFFNTTEKKLVQFDYILLSNYEEQIKAIESSIGSIQKKS